MCRLKCFKYIVCVIAVVLLASFEGKAQRAAVSTDVLQWATVSANLGFEIAVSQHNAFAFSASVCPVQVSERLSVSHISVSPEYKYWFNMPFYGHYAGADILYTSYKVRKDDNGMSGNLVAACANYGYSLILGKRWNMVPHAGVGVGVNFGEKTSFVPFILRVGINFQFVVK